MAQTRRIYVSLPDNLLKEVDDIATMDKTNRNKLVMDAMRLYLRRRKTIEYNAKIKACYADMAEINLHIAETCIQADNECFSKREDEAWEMESN